MLTTSTLKISIACLLLSLSLALAGCGRSVPSVQAQTAETKATVAQTETTKARHYCGAATKKGTPCRHLVKKDGDRCFMHQGKPAMTEDKAKA